MYVYEHGVVVMKLTRVNPVESIASVAIQLRVLSVSCVDGVDGDCGILVMVGER